MSSLGILSDQDLLDVYVKAKHHNLEKMFIDTILKEIEYRGLKVAVLT